MQYYVLLIPILHRFFSDRALKCPYPISANFEYRALYRGMRQIKRCNRCIYAYYALLAYYALRILRILAYYAILCNITHITHIMHYDYDIAYCRYCIVFLVTAHLKCPLSLSANFEYRALYRGCAKKRCNIDAILRIITYYYAILCYVLLRIITLYYAL
jgi:hypothetical protein